MALCTRWSETRRGHLIPEDIINLKELEGTPTAVEGWVTIILPYSGSPPKNPFACVATLQALYCFPFLPAPRRAVEIPLPG